MAKQSIRKATGASRKATKAKVSKTAKTAKKPKAVKKHAGKKVTKKAAKKGSKKVTNNPTKKVVKKTPKKPARKKNTSGPKIKRAAKGFTLHIIADSTGGLASHSIGSILTQFPNVEVDQQFHTFVDNDKKLEEALAGLTARKTMVVYSIINPDHNHRIHEACQAKNIPHFNLTGNLVQFLSDHMKASPVNELSRLHRTDPGYFKRMDAWEFTLQHDDSRRLDSIHEADIVLVGLSRVSKTPTSAYLGSMGFKVANVSLALETGFPRELKRVKKRIVALTVQPRHLYETRKRRMQVNKFDQVLGRGEVDDITYYDMRSIVQEVMYAEQAYRERDYPMVNITGRTVEEISVKVLEALNIQRRMYP